MSTSYRSETDGLQIQLAQQRARVEQESAQTKQQQRLYQKRTARSAAGFLGALCGVTVFASAGLIDKGGYSPFPVSDVCNCEKHGEAAMGLIALTPGLGASTAFLVLAPLLALLAYLLAFGLAGLSFRYRLRGPRPSDDLRWDVDRLSAWSPVTRARQTLDKTSFRSLALPLVALSLLGPLSLHFLFAFCVDGLEALNEFHEWIKLSVALVPQCHLVLAVLSVMHVRRLYQDKPTIKPGAWSIWGWTALSALIPPALFVEGAKIAGAGVILVGFVAVTGVFFIPAMIGWASRQHQLDLLSERRGEPL